MDQPSEEPPWDPTIISLLQVESTNEGRPSDTKVLFGDFKPRIRLSETCLKRWCAGDWWALFDWDEFGRTERFWEDKGSEVGVEKEDLEGTESESFGADESTIPGDSIDLCSYKRKRKTS